jgi:AI-2 transport protein TqsA
VRALLIDSNPAAWWWRPMIGDLGETRALMREQDGALKADRAERKAGARGPARPA